MKTLKNYFILFFMLIFILKSHSQIFIPIGYWKGLVPVTTNQPSPLYLVKDDIIFITAAGGMGVYTWANTAGAQADNSSITSTSAPVSFVSPQAEYIARRTAYTTDTITVTSATAFALSFVRTSRVINPH